MAVDLEAPIRIDAEVVKSAAAALRESFDAGFDIWAKAGEWHAVSPDGLAYAKTEQMAEPMLAEFLDQATTTKAPATRAADTAVELAIPIPQRGRVPLVAIGRLADVPADHLVRFATLFQREFDQRADALTLRHENQAFIRQVTNDFEELTFLRSMAELLEISDLSFDFTAMAETVLPTLKPLLEASELILLEARDIGRREEPEFGVGEVTVRAGAAVVEKHICRDLVVRFRSQCELQAVVKNHFHKTPEARDLPGVDSFILVPIVNADRIVGWLLALNRNNERNMNAEDLPWEVSYLEFGTHEATLMSSSAAILATHSRNVELFREREEMLVSMIRALVSAIEAKDVYTRGHSERVASYGKRLAEEMGLGDDYSQRLYLTGLLHDVGKIGVRDAVLRKPGPLTDEEFEEIKEHPDKGWAILQDIYSLSYVLPGVLHHHENYDGGGYPDNLAGETIPLDGRILAVADAFDAMTSDRPYRTGMPHHKAEAILRGGSGVQWDPEVIDAFFRAVPDILHIKENYTPRTPPQRKQPQLT
jgi:HD-GYP domain-containing protein (c-di-GMP phosphodiesterase class II)